MSKEFLTAGRIITGENAIEHSVKYFTGMGKKPLIVTGRVVSKLDAFKKLTELLSENGMEYTVFSDITGEPTDTMINKGLDVYRKNSCDFLIGIGGGSPLDSIKAIAALYACGGTPKDYMGKEITGKLPPMAAIPTTSGTGSEVTKFTVITDSETDVKMLLKGEVLIPDLAVIDYNAAKSSPKNITASTGLDALTHAVEAYTSKLSQPLTDSLALSAVSRIFKYLPIAYENGDDSKARYEMSIAALEAGMCINNSSVTVVHGMSRPIGALFHVPHGLSNAMLLYKCMKFAKTGAEERFAKLGIAAGLASDADPVSAAADKFIEGLSEICRKCNVPSVCGYGINKDEFINAIPKMTKDAIASGSPANTRKAITNDDIEEIYKSLVL